MKTKQPTLLQDFIRQPWLLVIWPALTLLYFYLLSQLGILPTLAELKRNFNKPPFEEIAIHSPIKRIIRYNRGLPVVALDTGDTLTLDLPTAGMEYVQVGDSIVKPVGARNVTVYRQYSTYTEVCLFGYDNGNGQDDLDYSHSGLLKRERVPHPPLPPRPLTQTFWPLLTKQD